MYRIKYYRLETLLLVVLILHALLLGMEAYTLDSLRDILEIVETQHDGQQIEVSEFSTSNTEKIAYHKHIEKQPLEELKILPIVEEKKSNEEPKEEIPILTQEQLIEKYIYEISDMYDVDRNLIMGIVYHESRFKPNVKNGNCVGLMQVSTYWHADRAKRLGVDDFYDPYSNILLGVDYISELINKYDNTGLALMLYNMRHDTAFKLHREGKLSNYAKLVLAKSEEYKKGV